ncbi:4-hydroxy-tetrahydrodipicolinate synthase [Salinicoccus bachuensis]|uniref:4-hydroxy-tetrahydrodipicolinate synthase n=1 Tax=Salinicoccus bachuensis TaxID=3136731 RepID=A0ABZ3CJX5_9STAP
MNKQLKGVFPVLITPMNEDFSVNYDGMKENVKYYLDQEVSGIVIVGSTGEFVSLDDEEKMKIVEMVSGMVKDTDTQLLVGISDERTDKALKFAAHAEEHQADGLLLINSYYGGPTMNEIYHQFKDVNDQVSTPVMIYNNPFTSGVDIELDTLYKIDQTLENVNYIKESSGEIRKVRDIARNSNLTIFCGSDDMALESFLHGATGWVSVAGNIAPNSASKMLEHVEAGNYNKAKEIYKDLLPLCEFLENSGKFVQIVKKAMDLKGLSGGPSRKPRLGLSDEEIEQLKGHMEKLN